MDKKKYFINLTNGLEFFQKHQRDLEDKTYSFIRLQSTAAEQKRWDFIIRDLDHNLLLNLAVGNECIIIDGSHHGRASRAQWQIVPWIKYVLQRKWFRECPVVYCRKHNVSYYFNECYRDLSEASHRKLKYYRKFLIAKQVRLDVIALHTKNDGKYTYFKNVLSKYTARNNEVYTNSTPKIQV